MHFGPQDGYLGTRLQADFDGESSLDDCAGGGNDYPSHCPLPTAYVYAPDPVERDDHSSIFGRMSAIASVLGRHGTHGQPILRIPCRQNVRRATQSGAVHQSTVL